MSTRRAVVALTDVPEIAMSLELVMNLFPEEEILLFLYALLFTGHEELLSKPRLKEAVNHSVSRLRGWRA
ncbi:MAG: hypothetical protein DMG64_14860 [Acidobacteria bacterium]|nr:MAG: hypothetical protein DMG64_14860 [Acidobacteriota bacterium]